MKTGKVGFISTQHLQGFDEIKEGLKVVMQKYKIRGFNIKEIQFDPEFDKPKIKHCLQGINFQPCAKGKHVPVIDRSTLTLKERCRATCHSLPYWIMQSSCAWH